MSSLRRPTGDPGRGSLGNRSTRSPVRCASCGPRSTQAWADAISSKTELVTAVHHAARGRLLSCHADRVRSRKTSGRLCRWLCSVSAASSARVGRPALVSLGPPALLAACRGGALASVRLADRARTIRPIADAARVGLQRALDELERRPALPRDTASRVTALARDRARNRWRSSAKSPAKCARRSRRGSDDRDRRSGRRRPDGARDRAGDRDGWPSWCGCTTATARSGNAARGAIEASLAKFVEKGKLAAGGTRCRTRAPPLRRRRSRISCGCDLVIEAIVEQLDAEAALWRRLSGSAGRRCLFATNTSSLVGRGAGDRAATSRATRRSALLQSRCR